MMINIKKHRCLQDFCFGRFQQKQMERTNIVFKSFHDNASRCVKKRFKTFLALKQCLQTSRLTHIRIRTHLDKRG